MLEIQDPQGLEIGEPFSLIILFTKRPQANMYGYVCFKDTNGNAHRSLFCSSCGSQFIFAKTFKAGTVSPAELRYSKTCKWTPPSAGY